MNLLYMAGTLVELLVCSFLIIGAILFVAFVLQIAFTRDNELDPCLKEWEESFKENH